MSWGAMQKKEVFEYNNATDGVTEPYHLLRQPLRVRMFGAPDDSLTSPTRASPLAEVLLFPMSSINGIELCSNRYLSGRIAHSEEVVLWAFTKINIFELLTKFSHQIPPILRRQWCSNSKRLYMYCVLNSPVSGPSITADLTAFRPLLDSRMSSLSSKISTYF